MAIKESRLPNKFVEKLIEDTKLGKLEWNMEKLITGDEYYTEVDKIGKIVIGNKVKPNGSLMIDASGNIRLEENTKKLNQANMIMQSHVHSPKSEIALKIADELEFYGCSEYHNDHYINMFRLYYIAQSSYMKKNVGITESAELEQAITAYINGE